MRAFEDFTVGEALVFGSANVTAEDIVAFAREFDPQQFHLDPAAPEALEFGGLLASGWHVAAIFMRLFADGLLLDSTCMGSPGIDMLKWTRPVRPGDTVLARATVLEARASRSRPEMGLVRFRHEAVLPDGALAMSFENTVMFGRRT